MVQIQAKLEWHFYRDERSRRYIAVCEPLKVTIEADSHAELCENIEDGLNLLFRNLVRDQEFDRFLQARGWLALGPVPENLETARFDVPFELIARKVNDSARAFH